MVLAAHADDETLGAGGYIPILKKLGCEVNVVIASNGILTVRGITENNRDDAYKACEILKVDKVDFLGYEDQRFDTYPIAEIANSVGNLRQQPDIIISHVPTDLNKDHRIIAEVAKIIGRPKKKPITILGSEIPNTSAWNAVPFPANFYVNIESTIELKIEAFSKYSNELQEFPHPWSRKGLDVLAQMRGMEAGCSHAEAFHIIRAFGP